ncbi:MAG: alpha/beta hydrolase [Armatimonadetes bacterium]|nr:alpha/beta hydrolase [Armatimonadota bacterium]
MRVSLDEVFDNPGDAALRFDLFAPECDDAVPAVVLLHGGGWISGDKSDVHEIARAFAAEGFASFCPQFRLAPLHPYPAAVEDCHRFLLFLRKEAKRFGIHPQRIGSFGNSAGGHLSVSLAVRETTEETGSGRISSRVNAAVDVAGLMDLTHPTDRHPEIAWDFISQFMSVPFEGNEERWVEASPLFHVNEHSAPILIVHGGQDDVVWPEQSERLYEALRGGGVMTDFLLLEGEGHSFSLEAYQEILRRSVAFFRERFADDC